LASVWRSRGEPGMDNNRQFKYYGDYYPLFINRFDKSETDC
jgi:hypothetical protein